MSETWIAMIPISLSAAEKHCLEVIDRVGEYRAAGYSTIDVEALQELEGRAFIAARRSETMGYLIYALTDIGRVWLRGCRPATLDEAA